MVLILTDDLFYLTIEEMDTYFEQVRQKKDLNDPHNSHCKGFINRKDEAEDLVPIT
jgi:hypothetical protein